MVLPFATLLGIVSEFLAPNPHTSAPVVDHMLPCIRPYADSKICAYRNVYENQCAEGMYNIYSQSGQDRFVIQGCNLAPPLDYAANSTLHIKTITPSTDMLELCILGRGSLQYRVDSKLKADETFEWSTKWLCACSTNKNTKNFGVLAFTGSICAGDVMNSLSPYNLIYPVIAYPDDYNILPENCDTMYVMLQNAGAAISGYQWKITSTSTSPTSPHFQSPYYKYSRPAGYAFIVKVPLKNLPTKEKVIRFSIRSEETDKTEYNDFFDLCNPAYHR